MSACPRCGAGFACGMADAAPDGPCWCSRLPPLSPLSVAPQGDEQASDRCFCPHCLRELLAVAPKVLPDGSVS